MIDISQGADSLYALSIELEDIHYRMGNELVDIAVIESHIRDFQLKRESLLRNKAELQAKEVAIKDAMAKIILLDRLDKTSRNYRNIIKTH